MTNHKGFEATPKKIKEARKKGKVIKSRIFTQGIAFLVILASIFSGLEDLWLKNQQMLEWCLNASGERLGACAIGIVSQTIWLILGSLVIGAIAVVLVEVLQVRFEFYLETLSPQINRLDLAAGLKRIGQGLCKSWLLFLKLFIVLMLARHFVLSFASSAQAVFMFPGREQLAILLPQIMQLSYLSSALLLVFGGVEYLFNRKSFMKEQSMSLDEVRREYKEEEGDPYVKSHRKALQEALIMQEMVRRVRSSKVIIVD